MDDWNKIKFITVAEYFAAVPENARPAMDELRAIIREAVPRAEEVISYNMPAFKQNGILVYYAAFKAHIGFFPTPSPIEAFRDELTQYKTSKGAILFPLGDDIPAALVQKIVAFRLAETAEKAGKKKK